MSQHGADVVLLVPRSCSDVYALLGGHFWFPMFRSCAQEVSGTASVLFIVVFGEVSVPVIKYKKNGAGILVFVLILGRWSVVYVIGASARTAAGSGGL